MRIQQVHLSWFKGVDVELPWASAVVLFGANDSGKTNILEGFVSNLGDERTVRTEPFLVDRESDVEAEIELHVELDGLDIEGHPDQEVFLSWMLTDCVEAQWEPQTIADESLKAEEEASWTEVRAEFVRLGDSPDRAHAVAQLVDRVRDVVRETMERRLSSIEDAERAELDLGEDVFTSNRFVVCAGGLCWLAPNHGRRTRSTWFLLLDVKPPRTSFASYLDPLGIRVIRITDNREASSSLYGRLENLLERQIADAGTRSIQSESGSVYRTMYIVNDAWVERDDDSTTLRPAIKEACVSLSALVNDLAPEFVSMPYEISIVPLFPDEWHAHGGRHVAIRLRPRSQEADYDLALASSGIAAWAGFAVSEAIRMTEEERAGRGSQPGADVPAAGATVYVFDEPETHLHPLAQEQAAAWVAERARAGANVLLASHAVPFLRLPLADAEYLQVTRSPEWETKVEVMTHDILGTVAVSASALGLPPVALIQLTRAWLVVEGEHDRKIIDALHGRELRQAGIQILPLRGANRAKATFLNLGVLTPLGQPFFCLLDNTRAEAVRTGKLSAQRMTEEERIADQILRLTKEKGVQCDVLGLPYPDIICALPIEAVREVARENKGKPGAASAWQDLIDRHEQSRGAAAEGGEKAPDFKRFVLEALGLSAWSADRLVDEALVKCEGQPPQGSPLARIVSGVTAAVSGGSVDDA